MKYVFISIAIAFSACAGNNKFTVDKIDNPANVNNPRAANKGPKGTPDFGYDTTFNYGTIQDGERAKHRYIVKNVGKGMLSIIGAQASCGCTSSDYTKDEIGPGETGYIEAVFNSTDKGTVTGSDVTKTITVTFNNSSIPEIILKLKAKVYSKK